MNNYTFYDVYYDDNATYENPRPSYKWFAGFTGETLFSYREFDSKVEAWDWIMNIATEL
mgnify:FL=1